MNCEAYIAYLRGDAAELHPRNTDPDMIASICASAGADRDDTLLIRRAGDMVYHVYMRALAHRPGEYLCTVTATNRVEIDLLPALHDFFRTETETLALRYRIACPEAGTQAAPQGEAPDNLGAARRLREAFNARFKDKGVKTGPVDYTKQPGTDRLHINGMRKVVRITDDTDEYSGLTVFRSISDGNTLVITAERPPEPVKEVPADITRKRDGQAYEESSQTDDTGKSASKHKGMSGRFLTGLAVILSAGAAAGWIWHESLDNTRHNDVIEESEETVEDNMETTLPEQEEIQIPAKQDMAKSPSNAPISQITNAPISQITNSPSRYQEGQTIHFYEGGFYYEDQAFPVMVAFIEDDGHISRAVYHNVSYGGRIAMSCRTGSNEITLSGKDGNNDFTITLHTGENERLLGKATDGHKSMNVRLMPSQSTFDISGIRSR